mgnify:CR=1 FL=1
MDRGFPWYKMVIIFLVAVLIMVSVFSGLFVNQSVAVKALENQGFSNIRVIDKQWFLVGLRGCGKDAAKFIAHAANPIGREVEVFVCVGWPFKGATVRSN